MSLKVEYVTLTGTDISNKYVFLSGVPADSTVALDLISGTAQAFTTDFIVDGTKVEWSGLNLDGALTAGDEMRVIYDRS